MYSTKQNQDIIKKEQSGFSVPLWLQLYKGPWMYSDFMPVELLYKYWCLSLYIFKLCCISEKIWEMNEDVFMLHL